MREGELELKVVGPSSDVLGYGKLDGVFAERTVYEICDLTVVQ